jgi:hypothetical protein
MAAVRVTVYWVDAQARNFTQSFYMDDAGFGGSDATLIAALQDLQDLSQADIDHVEISRTIAGSSFTGSQPVETGSFDSVGDRAILQFTKRTAPGVIQVSVPAPLDTIFQQSGAYALADVDPNDSLITALESTWSDADLLMTSEGGLVDFQKGWRQGQKHS